MAGPGVAAGVVVAWQVEFLVAPLVAVSLVDLPFALDFQISFVPEFSRFPVFQP